MSAAALEIIKGIKAFKTLISKNGNESGNGKNVLVILFGIILFLVLAPACAISLPGLIGKTSDAAVSFELEKSEIFDNINETYMKYSHALEEKIEKRKEELKKEYAYTKTIVKKDKKGKEVKQEITIYPEVTVKSNADNLPQGIVYAYIITKYIDVSKWKYDEDEILKFLEDNCVYNEQVFSANSDNVNLVVTITANAREEIAKKYFSDKKIDAFILSCNSFSGIDNIVNDNSNADINTDDLIFHENGMQIPHYLQYDKKWGTRKYGMGTISSSGCGPTCMAMIISYLTGQIVTPDMTSDWSMANGYYVAGQGTSWGFYAGAAKHWNLNSENIGMDYKKVARELSVGNPVVASMKPGTFTKGGHFIVLRGITAEGKILVNDPNDNYNTKNFYKRKFDLSLIVNECKNFWVISK